MKHTLKTTIIIAAIIIGLAAITAGVVQIISPGIHYNPEATLAFATAAQGFHDRMEPDLLDNVLLLAAEIASTPRDESSAVEASITQGILLVKGYSARFTMLVPTSDTLDLFSALKQEGSYVTSCYSKLYAAWSEKQMGDDSQSAQRLEEAREMHGRAVALREQNRKDLERTIAAAREDLEP